MAEEQLTTEQKNKIYLIRKYLKLCSAMLEVIDAEIQQAGTTGPNPINHTADDLLRTAEYIDSWCEHGVDPFTCNFSVPTADMGETVFINSMPAQLLIRYLDIL